MRQPFPRLALPLSFCAFVTACAEPGCGGASLDAGVDDAGALDGGLVDAGASVDDGEDAGWIDGGPSDAGETTVDAGTDAGEVDEGADAGEADAGPPPFCEVAIQSINGAVPGWPLGIDPGDDVVVNVSAPDGVAEVQWELVSRPTGSSVELTTPTSTSTAFAHGDTPGIDVQGLYRLRAAVVDEDGDDGACELSLYAGPIAPVHVQVVWGDGGDLDLHVIPADAEGRYCSPEIEAADTDLVEDCELTNGLPRLGTDVDDRCGYGPENTGIGQNRPGWYLIGVEAYPNTRTGCASVEPGEATVRIFLDGVLSNEIRQPMSPGDWWEAAILLIPNGGPPSIEVLGQD